MMTAGEENDESPQVFFEANRPHGAETKLPCHQAEAGAIEEPDVTPPAGSSADGDDGRAVTSDEWDEHRSTTTEFDGPSKAFDLVANHVRPRYRRQRDQILPLWVTPNCCVPHRQSKWGAFCGRGSAPS